GCQGKKCLAWSARESEKTKVVRAGCVAQPKNAELRLGENADRQYHHVASGKLQPLLERVRGMIVQHASEDIFLLEDELAAKEDRSGKFLGYRLTERFQFGDEIHPQGITVLGIPTQAVRIFDETLERLLGFPFEPLHFSLTFELASVNDTDGNQYDIF